MIWHNILPLWYTKLCLYGMLYPYGIRIAAALVLLNIEYLSENVTRGIKHFYLRQNSWYWATINVRPDISIVNDLLIIYP